ncbi:MAG TPA: hypothetical protein VJ046_01040 [Candidatus Paceibacterota bacterium]|nr:hypothetical protein [Candidatus Paceibacterota bacterium]
MSEKITKLIPSTKEKPKPEKPADVVDIESARKKRRSWEAIDTSSVLADALELVREGQLSDAGIDDLSVSDNEKTLLKVASGLFEGLRNKDKSIEELQGLIRQLKQRLGEESRT